VGGKHSAVDEVRLVLREQPLEAEQERELAPPAHRRVLGAGVELGERGVEPAPSGRARRERDLRILPGVDEPLARERLHALHCARSGKGCDRGGRWRRFGHSWHENR